MNIIAETRARWREKRDAISNRERGSALSVQCFKIALITVMFRFIIVELCCAVQKVFPFTKTVVSLLALFIRSGEKWRRARIGRRE